MYESLVSILTFQFNGVRNGECAINHIMARTNDNGVTFIAGIYSRQWITVKLENNSILQIYPQSNLSITSSVFMFHFEKGAKTAYLRNSFATALRPTHADKRQ